MKSSNFNKLLSSFVFSELRLLFYDYEIKYYKSLLKRNQFQSNNLKSTIDVDGVRHLADSTLHKTFGDFFANRDFHNKINGVEFDVMELEYKLDNAQYSHYQSSNNSVDAIRAKRIVFDSGHFIHAAESHKFYDITDLIVSGGKHATINRFKVDALQQGDIIAFINTDRDILVELVDQLTKDPSLSAIKYWTRLWRTLLIRHYVESNYNFSTLVNELRYNGCTKHEATIRSWLFDEGKIGPNDDSDLINIALMTNSKELLDNITTVREAIKKMTGWRMRAADVITERIKKKIHELASSSTIGDSITIDGLGTVNVLKVNEISNTWLIIDARYVNKLLRLDLD
jgi:hypothetical protein